MSPDTAFLLVLFREAFGNLGRALESRHDDFGFIEAGLAILLVQDNRGRDRVWCQRLFLALFDLRRGGSAPVVRSVGARVSVSPTMEIVSIDTT
jgi:hypothetical protein